MYLYIPLTAGSGVHITCPNYLTLTTALDMLKVLEDSAHKSFATFQTARFEDQLLSSLVTASILVYNKSEHRAESDNLNLFYTYPRILYRLEDCKSTTFHYSIILTMSPFIFFIIKHVYFKKVITCLLFSDFRNHYTAIHSVVNY
jgi:hypothetical protein